MNNSHKAITGSQISQSNVRTGITVPTGHVIVEEKWKGSELAKTLQGGLNILYEDKLGVIDFYPSSDMGVLYITEADLVSGVSYRRKLVKLRKAEGIKGVVIAEKTPVSSQYFTSLQKFTVLEIGLVLLHVSTQTEAANILIQMVNVENRPQTNQFRLKKKPLPKDQSVLLTVQLIPKLGETRARALLEKFHSIYGICNASEEELSQIVGRNLALHVKKFLTEAPS